MESFIAYFETIPPLHRSALIIGGLTFFFIIENSLPLFTKDYSKTKHTGLNLFFTLTTIIVNFIMAFILVGACEWVVENNFGVLQFLKLNVYATMILGLLMMDFLSAWLPHWVEHKVKWMWQFHLIHHTDQHVDTTTANRHHPGESVIRFVFTTISVILIGLPLWLIFLYQSISVILTQFNHSNVKIASWLDRLLGIVFCTPNMHRVHHHYRQPYSDKNYGNIFSFWDRIFGTYIEVDNSKLKYGVDTHMSHEEANDIPTLLKMPFKKYREHIEYKSEEVL